MPSVKRAVIEEDILDNYISEHNIPIAQDSHSD